MKNVVSKKRSNNLFYLWVMLGAFILYLFLVLHVSVVMVQNMDQKDAVKVFELSLEHLEQKPFEIYDDSIEFKEIFISNLKVSFIFYIALALVLLSGMGVGKGEFEGIEHGSGSFANNKDKQKFRKDKSGTILGEDLFLSPNSKEYNLNQFIIGGSGSGKTFRKIKPDILQANSNYVIVDIKGEIYRDTSKFLREEGYKIKVLNLIDPKYSMSFNPFQYVKDDKDVLILIDTFLKNTDSGKAVGGDPFWYKAEFSLMQALVFYIYKEFDKSDWTLGNVLKLLLSAVDIGSEDSGRSKSETNLGILDEIFKELSQKDEEHIAVKSYKMFKLAAGETMASILIGLSVRFSIFLTDEIKDISEYDEMDISSLSKDEKIAIYVMIPDTHRTFDVISAMFFSTLFQNLIYEADFNKCGSLPRHLRLLMDEFVNCGYIPSFDKFISTIRSRNISTTVIIQELSQIKAKYKDNWQTIIGCSDTIIFMGSPENETRDYISKMLGKTTVQSNSKTLSYGKKGGRSENINFVQRELMTPDELRVIDDKKQIVFIRGLKPIFVDKFMLEKKDKYKWLSEKEDYKKVKEERLSYVFDGLKESYENILKNID